MDQGLTELDGVRVQICAIEDLDSPVGVLRLHPGLQPSRAPARTRSGVRVARRFADSGLKPGGKVDVLGPNFKYCASDYFDCADHILAMSHLAVAEHLFGAGFRVTDVIPRFLPFSFRVETAPERHGSPGCTSVLR